MREAEGPSAVVVISEATARRFWPGEDPIGKLLKIGSERGSMFFPGEKDPFIASSEVIGIARDVRSMDLRKLDESYVYLPLSQAHQWTSTLLVRTEGDPARWLPATGQEVRRVDANLPRYRSSAVYDGFLKPIFRGLASRRLAGKHNRSTRTACGVDWEVYGIVSYSVARRTHEIGIRMALGAQSVQVLKLVLHEGFKPILAGLVAGVIVSAGVGAPACRNAVRTKSVGRGFVYWRLAAVELRRSTCHVPSGATGDARGPDGGAEVRISAELFV